MAHADIDASDVGHAPLAFVDIVPATAVLLFLPGIVNLMVASLIITVGVEVPIDNQIKTWTTDTLPADWTDLRLRWNQFHTLRTVTSLLSFVSLSIGVTGDVRKTGRNGN